MKNIFNVFLALACSLFVITASNADYFYDQGYEDAAYRTDFDSKTAGTSSNALNYDSSCLFTTFCGTGPAVGDPDFWYSSSSSVWDTGADFWVLHVNNEPAWSNSSPATGIDGVPGLVHELFPNTSPNWTKRPASFASITGSLVGETFYRAHLISRHLGASNSNDPNDSLGLPFISLGAQSNRGNNTDVGALNSSTRPDTVKFKARIWDFREPDGGPDYDNGGLWFMMYAITEWGGKQRGVFLNLKHLGDDTDWSTSIYTGLSRKWNWPIEESFFNPGVDWAFIDSEDLYYGGIPFPPQTCLIFGAPQMTSTGVDYQFSINLDELFRCASARGLFESTMPSSTVLPIKGVHWATEMNGEDGYIWASVHDMEME